MPTKAEALAELARRGKLPAPQRATNLAPSMNAQEQKTISDLRVAAQNIRGARTQAEEFGKLNREVGSGGIFGIPGVSEMVGAFNPKVAAMQGLSNAMIPGMHTTPGPMTDADAKLYKSAIPNPNLPGPANKRLRDDISRREQIASARVAFFEKWAATRGDLNGAETAFNKFWDDYSAKTKPTPPPPPLPRAGPPAAGKTVYLGEEK
jgi:hypothetical protein